MEIPISVVANYINNWVTGLLEGSSSQSVEPDKKYVLIRNWCTPEGKIVSLSVKGSDIMDSYNKHGMGKLPSWITNHPAPENFARRVFLYLIAQDD